MRMHSVRCRQCQRHWQAIDETAPRLFLMVAAACTDDTGPAYEQFNAQEEVMEVRVGEAEIGDVALLELHSSGAIVIGEASINPDAGPSGHS